MFWETSIDENSKDINIFEFNIKNMLHIRLSQVVISYLNSVLASFQVFMCIPNGYVGDNSIILNRIGNSIKILFHMLSRSSMTHINIFFFFDRI